MMRSSGAGINGIGCALRSTGKRRGESVRGGRRIFGKGRYFFTVYGFLFTVRVDTALVSAETASRDRPSTKAIKANIRSFTCGLSAFGLPYFRRV